LERQLLWGFIVNKERVIYFDILRITAVFCMILLHVSAGDWNSQPPSSFNWLVFNAYDSIVRFCVPVFVMISGVFFLNPEKSISVKSIYKKNILRIFTAFVFWSAFYAVFTSKIFLGINKDNIKIFIINFLEGHIHLWFLFMIMGLYMITPFLRKFITDKKATEYFLALSFIFSFLLPASELFSVQIKEILSDISLKTGLGFVSGFSFYYVLGYYISVNAISKKAERVIYILGILSVIFTILCTSYISIKANEPIEAWYAYLLPNVAFTALAVFVFFKSKISRISFSKRTANAILLLSKCSFGIYLVHDCFNMVFRRIGFTAVLFDPIFSVPVISIIVFGCSLLATYVIMKIPFSKYIL